MRTIDDWFAAGGRRSESEVVGEKWESQSAMFAERNKPRQIEERERASEQDDADTIR